MKKLLSVFLFASALNLVWENLHARLYIAYKGAPITEWILLRATFWDAVIVTVLCGLAVFLKFNLRPWFIVLGGLVTAVVMEKWALATSRWVYTARMPLVPFLHVGFTPAIQLALTALAAWFCIWYPLDAKQG